jgi:hypothetical protein
MTASDPKQTDFAGLFDQAETANRARVFERASGHLPDEMETAIRFHRQQIRLYHAAILALDLATSQKIKEEAHLMAVRVNHGDTGILADRDAPGSVLSTRCAARGGRVPLWGQAGRFQISVGAVRVLIAMEGMFGVGSSFSLLPGFSAHAVDFEQSFISETGYRSFLSSRVILSPNQTPADFASAAVAEHIAGELRGKLRTIHSNYRPA